MNTLDGNDIFKLIIGKSVTEAALLLLQYDLSLRVTKIGDQYTICTRDFRPDRVNVEIDKNEFIIKISGQG